MSLTRYFLLTIFWISAVQKVVGQVDVHLGVTTAYNATFVPDRGIAESPRYKSQMTYNWSPFALSAGVDFGKKFGLTLESIWSNQGQAFKIIDIADNVVGSRTIDLRYVHFPLMMKFMNEGNARVRGNFSIGPQYSFLLSGTERMSYAASTQTFVSGVTLPAGATAVRQRPDGNVQAAVPALKSMQIASKQSGDFRNSEFQIAAAFGLDIDLARHLYLSLQLRGNYSLTDTRSKEVIGEIKSGSTSDAYGPRRNLLVGVQTGIHYMFNSTRYYKFKGSRRR